MITLPDIKTHKPDLPEINTGINSLGLIIPFQPSLVDLKSINAILNYTLELVQTKLQSRYQPKDIKTIITKLKKIFGKLNYNSHRKSIAIIIKGEDEKIIYLDYNGKAVVFLNNPFSLLDLVADSVRNAEFELLIFTKSGALLYEYFNNSLHKVFAEAADTNPDKNARTETLIYRIGNIIKMVNKKNDKPVFIFSEDPQQTNKFCEFFSYREIVFKISVPPKKDIGATINFLVEKINQQWDHWQTKLIWGQIAIAKKNESLITHLNSVTKALKHSLDGLLLIDSFMKEEIHKSLQDETLFKNTQKLTDEIERFLERGNRIEITEGGLLEHFGGIALIKNKDSQFQSYRLYRTYKEEDFVI
jgi:hypothetical protein